MKLLSLCTVLLMICFLKESHGAIRYEHNEASKNLGNDVYFLIEQNGPLTFEDVSSEEFFNQFQLAQGPAPKFGIVNEVYWFRISIDYINEKSTPSIRYIETGLPSMDHIEFYSLQPDGEYKRIVSGDKYPFEQRIIKSHLFVFETYLIPDQKNHLYFRVATQSSLQMPISIWQPKEYIAVSNKVRLGLGLYYGSLLIMLLYNLFIYVSIKDKSYLFYILYLTSTMITQMSVDGVAYEFLWPNSPSISNYSIPIFLSTTVVMATLFAREFLNTRQFFRHWDISLRILIGIATLNLLLIFVGDIGTAFKSSFILLILMSLYFLVLGAWGIYKRERKAYFFFAAWLALCIGATAKASLALGIIPLNFVTFHGGQFGVLIELVLLSLALADRINQDRREKIKAMSSALIASKETLKANNERRDAEQRLVQQGLYDQLTGHPNRVLFKNQLQDCINYADKEKESIVVIYIHLNNFHDINNTLGHEMGDQLLITVISRLEEDVSQWEDIVGITQGTQDIQYVAVTEGVYLSVFIYSNSDLNISNYTTKLLNSLDSPVSINGMTLTIGGQIGVAKWPEHASESEELMQKAMIAVRAAKWAKRDIQFYEERIDKNTTERLSLLSELKIAINEQQLELRFQPKVNLKTKQTISVEALIRWNHPEKGLLGPDKFIDLAESTGIIQPLTQWVLNSAIMQCAKLQQEGYEISVAVNVSARNLLEVDFVTYLVKLLKKHDLAPSKLTLEMVESTMIEDMTWTINTLNKLEKLGIRLSIDDFGTGYSSLAYLKKLPVHELKIDRSFISDMLSDEDDKLIVDTSLAIAHQRKMQVVAEGIEDEPTFNLLDKMGCDIGQGYFISKPINFTELTKFLKNEELWQSKAKFNQ